ncbi:MAG: hypothetical protein IK025_10915 [Bacteroidales bacterium]|nr:hypothetical protein [Bacteroidales bacterium]
MDERIQKISERWFLVEPALFSIYCTHQLSPNTLMDCPIRCGQGMVEYNPNIMQTFNDAELEEALRSEMIRLFLKHPYERQPENSLPEALSFGSDMVLGQHYHFKTLHFISADNFQLPAGECFEWYVDKLNEILRNSSQSPEKSEDDSDEQSPENEDNDSDSQNDDNNDVGGNSGNDNSEGENSNDGNSENDSSDNGNGDGNGEGEEKDQEASVGDDSQNEFGNGLGDSKDKNGFSQQDLKSARDHSALWEEDELKQQEINEIIASTTNWGSIPGDMVEQIKASLIVKLDYRKVLSSFHTSILSSHRHLTRMRPNRRSGFDQMGSIYELASKLLVAVDVSGSVTSKTLQAFYSVIARFFKYGIVTIDTIQFDTTLKGLESFKKASKEVKVTGRGGTNFQPIFDYIREHRQYDGLIILTDGYAAAPKVDFPMRTKVLWICQGEDEYNRHKEWMKKTGKACWIKF